MFNLFKKDPIKQLNDEYLKTLNEAMQAQRNGDIKTYSFLSQQAEDILKKIDEQQAS